MEQGSQVGIHGRQQNIVQPTVQQCCVNDETERVHFMVKEHEKNFLQAFQGIEKIKDNKVDPLSAIYTI